MLYVRLIQIANVNAMIGGGISDGSPGSSVEAWTDAYDFNALSQGRKLDLPTLTPANRLTVEYYYTGKRVEKGGARSGC